MAAEAQRKADLRAAAEKAKAKAAAPKTPAAAETPAAAGPSGAAKAAPPAMQAQKTAANGSKKRKALAPLPGQKDIRGFFGKKE